MIFAAGTMAVVAVRAIERGLVETFAGEASHTHHLTNTDKVVAAGVNEDAIRSGWIAIPARSLNIEAGSGGSTFEVAHHNALG